MQELKDIITAGTDAARKVLRDRIARAANSQYDQETEAEVAEFKKRTVEQLNDLAGRKLVGLLAIAVYEEPGPAGEYGFGCTIVVEASHALAEPMLQSIELEMKHADAMEAVELGLGESKDEKWKVCSRRRAFEAAQNRSGPNRDDMQAFISAIFGGQSDGDGPAVVIIKADGDFGPRGYEPEAEGGDTAH